MECDNCLNMLSAYQDGELETSDQQTISHHLSECTECRMKLDEMNRLYSEMSGLSELEMPSSFTTTVMSRINERNTVNFSDSFNKKFGWLYAALFFIIFSIGTLMIDISQEQMISDLNGAKTDHVYVVSLLSNEEQLGLLDIQANVMDIIEKEISDEN